MVYRYDLNTDSASVVVGIRRQECPEVTEIVLIDVRGGLLWYFDLWMEAGLKIDG